MSKQTFLVLVMGLALAIPAVQSAYADSVNSELFTGSQIIRDNSGDKLANVAGGATTVDVGDRLFGIFNFLTIQQGANSHNIGGATAHDELTGVFDIQVVAVADNHLVAGCALSNSCYTFTFGAVSAANFLADTGVSLVALGLPGANTSFVFWDGNPNNYNDGTTVATGLANAKDGTFQWAGGFGGANTFWTSSTATNDISVIGGAPQGVIGGTFQFGQNQLTGGVGPVLGPTGCNIGNVGFCGNGSLTAKVAGSGWDSGNQDQVAINVPVPEPSTLLLLGSGLAGLGFWRSRRKA